MFAEIIRINVYYLKRIMDLADFGLTICVNNLFEKLWLAFSQKVTFRHESIESVLIRISLSRGVAKRGGEAGGRHLPQTLVRGGVQ